MSDGTDFSLIILPHDVDDFGKLKSLKLFGEEVRDDVYAETLSNRETMIVLVQALFAWAFDIECGSSQQREGRGRITKTEAMRYVMDYIAHQIAAEESKARPI